MGVDATLFIVADYSRTTLYASAMIALGRWSSDWDVLNSIPQSRHAPQLQVMRGSWCTLGDGTRPEGIEGHELGYLSGDSYTPDEGFKVCRVSDLAARLADFGEYNRKIIAFVVAQYPDHEFLVIWH